MFEHRCMLWLKSDPSLRTLWEIAAIVAEWDRAFGESASRNFMPVQIMNIGCNPLN